MITIRKKTQTKHRHKIEEDLYGYYKQDRDALTFERWKELYLRNYDRMEQMMTNIKGTDYDGNQQGAQDD